MISFLTLHRGESVANAKLVAISADPAIIQRFAAELLDTPEADTPDPILGALDKGRRRALTLVASEGRPTR